MTGDRRSSLVTLLTVSGVLVSVAVSAVINMFTGILSEKWAWARDLRLMTALVVASTVLLLVITVAQQERWTTVLQRRFPSRYPHRYRAWVSRVGNRLDIVGLVTTGPATPHLDDVFVSVALTSRSPVHVWPGVVGADEVGGRHAIETFLDQREPVVLVVLGAPGSGKTTLLHHVALESAQRHRDRTRPVPVLLALRKSAPKIVQENAISLPALIRSSIPHEVGEEPPGWWEGQLAAGNCAVLLDGLDEVADIRQRRAVVAWINDLLTVYPRNDFVIASRPHGYRESRVDATVVLQVLPFNREQVERFLRRWYRTAERHAGRDESPAVANARGDEAARHLIGQLNTLPGLADLAVNPLLLTMIAEVHRHGRRRGRRVHTGLPANRATLYGEMCEVMVWRRDQERDLHVDLPGPQRIRVLGRLAFAWMRRGIRSLGHRELHDLLRPWLDGLDPEEFLVEMERTGLLLAPESYEVTFAHLTFQEYLAARHIAEEGHLDVLQAGVDDIWWRETTLLYADLAEDGPDAIITSALRAGTANALFLAAAVDEASDRVSRDLRNQLNAIRESGHRPGANPLYRAVAVDALVGRHLRAGVVTFTGARIGREPVSNELYELFRLDSGAPQTDGWHQGGRHSPARGIWRSDVEAFLVWVNKTVALGPRNVTFRLPTEDELAVVRPDYAVWTVSGRTFELTTPSVNVLAITGKDLASDLARDLVGSSLLEPELAAHVLRGARELKKIAGSLQRDAAMVATAVSNFGRATERDPLAARRAGHAEPVHGASMQLRNDALPVHRLLDRLVTALTGLQNRDADLVKEVDSTLSRIGVGDATRTVEVSMHEPFDTDDLGLSKLLRLLMAIGEKLDTARQLLRRKAPTGAGRHPVDQMLALLPVLPNLPALPAGSENPQFDFAVGLLPGAYRPSADPLRIDLERLDARVDRLAHPPEEGPLAELGFTEALRRLHHVAQPAASRARAITEQDAAAVRVPALVLARKAQLAGDRRLTGDLIELAAAMSLLQRRASMPHLLETIHLVHD